MDGRMGKLREGEAARLTRAWAARSTESQTLSKRSMENVVVKFQMQ